MISPECDAVQKYVATHDRASPAEIASAIGLSVGGVRKAIRDLKIAGRLTETRWIVNRGSVPNIVESLLSQTSLLYGIPESIIMGRTRSKTAVIARNSFCRMLREYTTLSYPEIGRIMGRDHATIISMVKRAKTPQGTEP